MTTAHNDITGDSIRAGKGSLEKYAQGWEGIFQPKQKEEPPTFTGNCNCGQIVEVKGFNVEWTCIGCGEKCGIFTGGYG
jgi:hypothetical protein